MDMNLSKLQEIVEDREVWHTTVHRVAKSWTNLATNNNNKYEKLKQTYRKAYHCKMSDNGQQKTLPPPYCQRGKPNSCMKDVAAAAAAKSLQSCLTLCTPQTAAHQAPPFLGFSRQEHWSGLPFPSPMYESAK